MVVPSSLRAPWLVASVGAAVAGGVLAYFTSRFGFLYAALGFLTPFAFGTLGGFAFGHRERDVALPMPFATPVVAFAFGLFLGGPIVGVLLAAASKIGGP